MLRVPAGSHFAPVALHLAPVALHLALKDVKRSDSPRLRPFVPAILHLICALDDAFLSPESLFQFEDKRLVIRGLFLESRPAPFP